ncbi:glycerophosphodiester phosphodiesterase [Occultella glacieicola]|nr:glycerophosphodiester phosphodiesterase family protein [Occultella glacieicola]
MKVYAHRGASLEHPENTLAAFTRAVELGAEGIELDCYKAKDGTVVVIHDNTLDRTTNVTGAVKEWTAAELRDVDAGNGEHVPTLKEVLTLVAGKIRVNVEVNDPTAVEGVIEVTGSIDGLDWFASSAQWEVLAELRERAGADVYPLTIGTAENAAAMMSRQHDQMTEEQVTNLRAWARQWPEAVGFAKEIGAAGLSIYEVGLTPGIVAAIHKAGLEVWAWTINDPARADELAAMGVDAVCTDAPAELIAAREVAPGGPPADRPRAHLHERPARLDRAERPWRMPTST